MEQRSEDDALTAIPATTYEDSADTDDTELEEDSTGEEIDESGDEGDKGITKETILVSVIIDMQSAVASYDPEGSSLFQHSIHWLQNSFSPACFPKCHL